MQVGGERVLVEMRNELLADVKELGIRNAAFVSFNSSSNTLEDFLIPMF